MHTPLSGRIISSKWNRVIYLLIFFQLQAYCNESEEIVRLLHCHSWWRHQMGTFSALLALCAGNSPVSGEFPTQRPVTRSFDVFFDLRPNKRLSKQSWGWWFETLLSSLWRHHNVKLLWNTMIKRHVPNHDQTSPSTNRKRYLLDMAWQ